MKNQRTNKKKIQKFVKFYISVGGIYDTKLVNTCMRPNYLLCVSYRFFFLFYFVFFFFFCGIMILYWYCSNLTERLDQVILEIKTTMQTEKSTQIDGPWVMILQFQKWKSHRTAGRKCVEGFNNKLKHLKIYQKVSAG